MSSIGIRELAAELAARAGLNRVSRSTLMSAALICVVLAATAAWRWWPTPAPDVVTGGTATDSPAAVNASAAPDPPKAATVVVHVAGSVRHPGVYELEKGSRVIDAVTEAGGLMADAFTEGVNLARVLEDGEQLLIPDEDEAVVAGREAVRPNPSGRVAGETSRVDINSADVSVLDTLPGIGPSTAAKIVAEREANGRYGSVDELVRVAGIGPKRLEALRDLVCAQ